MVVSYRTKSYILKQHVKDEIKQFENKNHIFWSIIILSQDEIKQFNKFVNILDLTQTWLLSIQSIITIKKVQLHLKKKQYNYIIIIYKNIKILKYK